MVDPADKLLVQQALAKRRAGQELTERERAALNRAQSEAQADLLRAVSPTLFCDLFGIQNNQRNLWEEQLGIPCGRGRKAIDLYAVGAVLRKICSKRVELSEATPDMHATKLRKMQAEIEKLENQIYRARVENEELARLRLPRPMILERLKRMATIIRSVGDRFAGKSRLTGLEAQRMLNKAIEQYDRELAELDAV